MALRSDPGAPITLLPGGPLASLGRPAAVAGHAAAGTSVRCGFGRWREASYQSEGAVVLSDDAIRA